MGSLMCIFSLSIRNNVALLNVFYKDGAGSSYKYDIRFETDDFICKQNIQNMLHNKAIDLHSCCLKASIGGFLVLGFGFSLISAMEIIYFFGFRWLFGQKLPSPTVGRASLKTICNEKVIPGLSIKSPMRPHNRPNRKYRTNNGSFFIRRDHPAYKKSLGIIKNNKV